MANIPGSTGFDGLDSVLSNIFGGPEGDLTRFWEISGITLSVMQMIFYLYMMLEYQDKLRDYAGKLNSWASQNRNAYDYFRELDEEFYEYYKNLPEYEICESAVHRNKGQAFYKHGSTMRSTLRTNRGYTPLKAVHINYMIADRQGTISSVAMRRGNVLNIERHRKNVEQLEKWATIIGSPVGVESYGSGAMSGVIRESFKTMSGFGQGFNSAGSAFGTQLYRILD